MPRDAKDIIGEAALADLLKDYDVTPKSPPKMLVTMEESAKRDDILTAQLRRLDGNSYDYTDWDNMSLAERRGYNAADNWLVKAVNRRIIGGLPRPHGSPDADHWAELGAGSCNFAARHALFRIFCGEETP